MSITLIGYIALSGCLICLIVNPRGIWRIALLLSIFQASAAFLIGAVDRPTGISPGYVPMIIGCFVQIFAYLTRPLKVSRGSSSIASYFLPMTSFVIWAVVGSAIMPVLLGESLSVMRYGSSGLGPLEFSPSTFRHSAYLCTGLVCSISLALFIRDAPLIEFTRMVRWLRITGWVAGAMLLWHSLHLYADVPFPSEAIQSNPGAVQNPFGYMRPDLNQMIDLRRPSGTFSEPSFAAMFLSGFVGLLLGQFVYGKHSVLKITELLVSILLLLGTTSTAGLFALGLLGGVFLFTAREVIFGKRWIYYWPRLGALMMALCLIAGGAMVLSDGLRAKILQSIDLMVIDKLATDAGKRGEVELNALRVFKDSYFLGGGLGSNECFTVGGYVLSNTGLIGGILVGLFGLNLLKITRRTLASNPLPDALLTDIRSLVLFIWGLVLAGIVGVQILFQPILWITVAMLVGVVSKINGLSACRFGPECSPRISHPERIQGLSVG